MVGTLTSTNPLTHRGTQGLPPRSAINLANATTQNTYTLNSFLSPSPNFPFSCTLPTRDLRSTRRYYGLPQNKVGKISIPVSHAHCISTAGGSNTAYNWVDLKVRVTTTAAAGFLHCPNEFGLNSGIAVVLAEDMDDIHTEAISGAFTDQLCLQYSPLSRTQTQVASAHSGVLLQIWSGHVSRMGSNSTRYLHHTCAWNAAGHAGCSGCGCTVFARVHKARQQPSRIQIGVAMAGRRQPRMCMRVGVMSMRTRLHVIPSRTSSCPARGTVPRWGAEDGDMKVEFEVAYEEEEEIKGEAITLRYEAVVHSQIEAQIENSRHYGHPPIGTSVIGAAIDNVVPLAARAIPYDVDSPGVAATKAWTNLKEVFKVVRDGSDLCLPLKAALVGVTAIMDSIDRVGDVNDEFVRITNNVKGFQCIFSQYGSEKDISPAMRSSLDAMTSSVITSLSTAAPPNLVSRELKLIEEAMSSKTERGLAMRTLEAAGDVDKVVIAFKRLGNVIDRFQLGTGLRMEHGVESIAANMALEKLGYVTAAEFDSQSPEGCLKGTRVDLLSDLRAWSRDTNSPRIFWLDGMAGTGKSAVARWFCHMLREDNQLGGSFFCLRGDANRGNPKHILPTLAVHLSPQIAAYKWALLAAVDKGISWNANLKIQVENLLVKPLHSDGSGPPTLVLVIDALDELDDEDATKDLLRRLIAVVPSLPIKLFVTSRPEWHIRPQFDNPADFRRVLRLHDIEHNIVTADISLYLRTCLDSIQADNSSILPPTWASPADVEALTHRAGRLFIYASTAVKYIRESPRSRLQTLISSEVYTKGPLTKPLDDLYNHILLDAVNIHRDESKEISLTKQILGTILTMGQPVSVASLGGLLGVPAWQVRERLDRLHAVIHVPAGDNDGVLSTFHASFGDFLTTTGRTLDEMLISPPAAHAALFSDCVRIMDSELHFNVSNCPTSYFPNTHHKFTIPALLQYVCLYWAHHIAAASATEASDVEVFITSSYLTSLQDVFLPEFLFWVEVLSAINKASAASSLIMKALTAKCFMHGPPYMTDFLVDANEFVLSSR
ncbi:hypothetical protein B0H11DRAFT_2252667 [Mycena galericulata]|nr:hypothetical protein B0H11DRAFT_2252667 [Mycena galericulata]